MRVNSRYFTGCAINVPLNGLPISEEGLLAEIRPHPDPAAQKRLDKHLLAARATGPSDAQSKDAANAPAACRATSHSNDPAVAVGFRAHYLLLHHRLDARPVLGMVGWSGLRALFDLGTGRGEWWHAPVGLTTMAVGVLVVFVWMGPAVRKLSGRDPIEPHNSY